MSATPSNSTTKTTHTRALIWACVIGLFFYLVWGGALWFIGYRTHLIAALAIGFIITLLIGWFSFWLMTRGNKNSAPDDTDALIIKKHTKLIAMHFLRMLKLQKQKKHFASRYDQPIYLLLSDDPLKDKNVITQMGYEAYKVDEFGNDIDFPILFWVSEHSILIYVSLGKDQHPEYIKALCTCLNKWRPRQALNGVLLTTDVATLLKSEEQISQYADSLKADINIYKRTFGLNLPIYNIITNMGNISDFCQFFSAFDENKRDDVFGATAPYQEHGGIDANWYNQEFDHLISQLIASMSTALAGQLNQDYRNSIASAPYQFGLLKQSLWLLLRRLYRGDQLTDGLMFRGFYFTHDAQAHQQNDLLAGVINYQLGNESHLQTTQIPVQQTLFAQHIMTHVVLNEHELVGTNKRKESFLWLSQIAYTSTWIVILGVVMAVIKFDFDYQSAREARADRMLENYKEAISASPYDIENMVDNIPNLYAMRSIYSLYTQPEPWFSLSFLPDSSIKLDVEKAYVRELQQVLIPSLENTIEKDLFVYVSLEEQAKTLSLLNNYRLLFDKQRSNTQQLKSYFIETLNQQGEADSTNVAQLGALLNDIFAQELAPTKVNNDLESLAKKVISQTGVETLLYEHIKNSTTFSNRIDVRNDLGNNFTKLFAFSPQYVGYLVPYIYTPAGFNELDLSVSSPLIAQALQTYQGVTDSTPSASEMYRISRDLKQTYQNDYINYWRDFISHVSINSVSNSAQLDSTLKTLSIASANPLSAFYQTITKYTTVDIQVQAATSSTKGASTNQETAPQDIDKKESAQQITLSFQAYHQQVSVNQQNQKPLDELLTKVAQAKTWLDQYFQANDPELLAYQTLTNSVKQDDPISSLATLADQQQPLIKQLLEDISTQSNDVVLFLAHEYLNTSWQNDVYNPYQSTLASFYPFKATAGSDASVVDVTAFFKEGGMIDSFNKTKLSRFVIDGSGHPYLDGLIPNTGLALAPELWTAIEKANKIKQALFLVDPNKAQISFQLEIVEMSSNLTQFTISTTKPIFSYQHGPVLWSDQLWQGASTLTDTLNVNAISPTVSTSKVSYKGDWNWFKLIEPNLVSTSEQNTTVQFLYGKDKVQLGIKTQGQVNPFQSAFFASFTLPNDI